MFKVATNNLYEVSRLKAARYSASNKLRRSAVLAIVTCSVLGQFTGLDR